MKLYLVPEVLVVAEPIGEMEAYLLFVEIESYY
jgi:hypothetical protein